jgi:hypothetical protein
MAISLQKADTPSYETHAASELRLLYQIYEEAQRGRIAHGERLRAILQGRSLSIQPGSIADADSILKRIGRGETAGAPRLLERAYSRAMTDEICAAEALREAIETHAAWPWLSSVKGVGHLLAARLLSRLDIARAKTPSAFWAYCGLGTIAGIAYRCSQCTLEVAYPIGYLPRGPHRALLGTRTCPGKLEAVPDNHATRVAPRRAIIGGRGGYDARARESCYLVGVSMLRCGSDYRSIYDSERERLAIMRPGWTLKRCHLSALRKMEKAFLRDLWVAWRRAVDLPVVPPYFPHLNE